MSYDWSMVSKDKANIPERLIPKAGSQSPNVSGMLNYDASEQEGISSEKQNKTALKPFLM